AKTGYSPFGYRCDDTFFTYPATVASNSNTAPAASGTAIQNVQTGPAARVMGAILRLHRGQCLGGRRHGSADRPVVFRVPDRPGDAITQRLGDGVATALGHDPPQLHLEVERPETGGASVEMGRDEMTTVV